MTEDNNERGAGGTPGGVGLFFIGMIMALSGAYLLTNQIHVTSNFWGHRFMMFGGTGVSAFGITLIPFMLGIGMVFFNGRSVVGWLLTGGSILFIIIGVLANLQVYFVDTTLYVTLLILILLVGGIGLVLRSIRSFR